MAKEDHIPPSLSPVPPYVFLSPKGDELGTRTSICLALYHLMPGVDVVVSG
jgi:hypothetical protein